MLEYKKPEEIIVFKNHKIIDWKSIEIKDTEMILYYDLLSEDENEKIGFNFYCIEAVMWECDTEKIIGCKCVYNGVAYWDGVRHLYFGDEQTDNYGYHYYPSMENLILALKELEKLEKKYCTET